jgi:cyclophilin family peptidyl-prolyl cis-trans isomerase
MMPPKQYYAPEDMGIDPAKTYNVTLDTDKGVINLRLYPDVAPQHVNSFVFLSSEGFYDGLTFHRVEPGFVIQGGDPSGNGTGGPGYRVKAEFNDRPHKEGALAMARSQSPDSAGSQFYITLAPTPFLDRQYTVFGEVTSGMDVVKKIRKGDKIKSVKVQTS